MDNLKEQLQAIENNIGKNIQQRRSVLGVSRVDLGKCIGVTGQQISKYENGLNRISISRLSYLAKRLNSDIDYFYSDLVFARAFENSNHSELTLALMKKISKIQNNNQKKALVILLDGLL